MSNPNRGEVWLVDLGYVAKVRPCLSDPTMSQNHRNSNPIYLLGAIAGIISAIVTVLTYLEIKPSFINPSVVISAPRVDWKKATLVTTLGGHSGYVESVAIGPDGKTLVSGSRDKTIKIWRAGSSN